MEAIKIVSLVGGVAIGLSAVFTVTSCTPVDDSEEARGPADQSTGIPDEVADEIEPLNKRLESDALSEAGLRVKGEEKDAKTFATQSTGIPEEVAEEVDAVSKKLEADALSEAGLRVKGITEEETVSANQSTGIPDEVADEIEPLNKRLESDALSEAGMRVKGGGKDAETFATQSTGIPEEVADEVDAISQRLVAEAFSEAGIRVNRANENATSPATQSASEEVLEVEVKRSAFRQTTGGKREAGDGGKPHSSMVELEFVTFNRDKSLFVGYYQDGWFEMVSLHDAETKKQLANVYCDGGVPTVFRFSKDNRFLGAKTGVGWYVWKIPSFEKVFVLGDIDIDRMTEEAEQQGGADQPATPPESNPKGRSKSNPESE